MLAIWRFLKNLLSGSGPLGWGGPIAAVLAVFLLFCWFAGFWPPWNLSKWRAGGPEIAGVNGLSGPGIETASPAKRRGSHSVWGNVFCDCDHVDAGLLTGPYIRQCQDAEKKLQDKVRAGTFHVEADNEGKLVSGDFCDDVAGGPAAWPVLNGPASPPRPNDQGKKCRFVGGLVQFDCGG